ncbi:MAG TPA: efflux RND transporter periplasmic adaptor subunit [Edaphobacter sp.]|nr:efflux RND transporter periplasmic adaptor subunit [Edaphobacter sp.]
MTPRSSIQSVSAALLLCIATAFFAGCNRQQAQPTPVVYVDAVHPKIGSISEQITADAVLAPLAQAAISPKITAPVKKFYVQRGAHVRAGQLLVTLDNRDLAAAALDSKGAYAAAEGAYATETRSQVPANLTKAQTDLAQAKANLDLNQSIVNARSQLFAQGAIPGRDLDTAKAALVQAQSAYDIAKQNLTAIEKTGTSAALQTAKGQLTSAKAKYLGAEAQLSYTEIRSPINGVVTDRPLFAGETAAAGSAVITVMDTSALLAKLHISQMEAQQLSLGAPATITVPGIPEPVPAKVSLISPALDPGSTTVEIWLRLENPKGIFKAGTPVHTTITGRTANNALVIPAEAVQTSQDGTTKFVMVIGPDDIAHKRNVTLGIQTPQEVQVTSGISSSDTVITTGAYAMDDGTKVKIGKPPAEKSAQKSSGGDDE